MPRLFTGLEVPPDIAESLALLRGGISGARWIDVENYHVTLRFIGDIDDRTASDIAGLLDGVRRRPVTVMLDELSVFGGDKPRAIVMKARPEKALLELQAEHERLVRRVGLPPEPRKFTPHITLARLRGVSTFAAADYLAMRGGLFLRSFEAKSFVLYSSRDSVGGGPYVIEERYPLN